MPTIDSRVSVLEAHRESDADGIEKIWKFLSDNGKENNERHTEIMQTLSVIQTTTLSTKEYENRCEQDRKEMDGRIGELEKFRANQSGKISVWSAVINAATGLVGVGVGSWLSSNWEKFSSFFK